jgi:hypothetical protein
MYRQRERFYVASMEASTQGEASPDRIERVAKMEARWWTLDELRTTEELVEPPGLHEIVAAPARPAPAPTRREPGVAGLGSTDLGVPPGSCTGTGRNPLDGSIDSDRKGRETGVCPVCLGRFRVNVGVLQNHAPSPNLEATVGQS